jgi:hypothetical protein
VRRVLAFTLAGTVLGCAFELVGALLNVPAWDRGWWDAAFSLAPFSVPTMIRLVRREDRA